MPAREEAEAVVTQPMGGRKGRWRRESKGRTLKGRGRGCLGWRDRKWDFGQDTDRGRIFKEKKFSGKEQCTEKVYRESLIML